MNITSTLFPHDHWSANAIRLRHLTVAAATASSGRLHLQNSAFDDPLYNSTCKSVFAIALATFAFTHIDTHLIHTHTHICTTRTLVLRCRSAHTLDTHTYIHTNIHACMFRCRLAPQSSWPRRYALCFVRAAVTPNRWWWRRRWRWRRCRRKRTSREMNER
jgi:hypothetical protein